VERRGSREEGGSVPSFESFGRILMGFGVLLLLVGAAFAFGGRLLHLGRLPGDIIIRRGTFTFYFPLVTSIVVSVLLSLILGVVLRLIGRR